jgi:hypothetical protein
MTESIQSLLGHGSSIRFRIKNGTTGLEQETARAGQIGRVLWAVPGFFAGWVAKLLAKKTI